MHHFAFACDDYAALGSEQDHRIHVSSSRGCCQGYCYNNNNYYYYYYFLFFCA